MKELMQKALQALGTRRNESSAMDSARAEAKRTEARTPEEWGMSPEDALRVGTVARYK
ncbi:hypothetical protein [Marinobacter nauticus]|uniref:hypothetical protein n=1 Tax=Marinobacter nauticus TaxID=2743 RepID=UPI000F2D0207|nr:hypothetical protein [Marinobacter nauticus]RKR79463.1 hypothetical protein C7436_0909 [Marinobacter nauticus]